MLTKVLLWLVLAPGLESAPLVIATYNVENYGPADRMTEHGFERDYPKPEAEKAALRKVIAGLGADILALQEMGSPEALEELRRDLRGEGTDYPYSAWLEAEDRRRHVALLAKRPLNATRLHPDIAFAYLGGQERVKRGVLEAAVETAAGELTLFVVHLKSHREERKDDPEGEIRRRAEAAAVRDCILREFPDPERSRFVVLGDCNDGSHSPALLRLCRRGERVVAVRLPAADSRGETWTEAWARGDRYSELDHILISTGLRADLAGAETRIEDGPEVARASDHRPVLARLDLIPQPIKPKP